MHYKQRLRQQLNAQSHHLHTHHIWHQEEQSDGQTVWFRPPDPSLWTWEEAGSASLTLTLVPVGLISRHRAPPHRATLKQLVLG